MNKEKLIERKSLLLGKLLLYHQEVARIDKLLSEKSEFLVDKNIFCSLLKLVISQIEEKEYECYQREINLGYQYCTIIYLTQNDHLARKEMKDKIGLIESELLSGRGNIEDFFINKSDDYYILGYKIDAFSYLDIENIDLNKINIDYKFPYVSLYIRDLKKINELTKENLVNYTNNFIDQYKKSLKRYRI